MQGYKFNIFYPDLIDKAKTPQYKLIKQRDNPDTCILLFTAGPPYEDLAFTIVNKEWEYSHKKGFKSVTEHRMSTGEGMPRSRPDWEPIMRFWGQHLVRRSALESSGELYEIKR